MIKSIKRYQKTSVFKLKT